MPTKRELEESFHQYRTLCRQAADGERHHAYPNVLQLAIKALPFLRDTIAFQRRYEKVEKPPLKAIDLLLRYSPAFFSFEALDRVESWFAGANRVERKLYADLPHRLQSARDELRNGIESWPSWDSGSTALDPHVSSNLTRIWLDYGSIKLCPEEGKKVFRVVTHSESVVSAKCAECTEIEEGLWLDILEAKRCPQCGEKSNFYLLKRLA